jgi:hypothetical protein
MTRRVTIMVLLAAAMPCAAQPADPLPSLDDLLGLDEPAERPADAEAIDPVEAELDRELGSDGTIADNFVAAVELMRESAERLGASRDTGAVTQRIQSDVLRRLDQLIEQAKQQGGQSSPSSSSPSQSQQGQQPDQRAQQQPREATGQESTSTQPPAGQAAQPGQSTANAAAWGALPARLRDALLQGSSEGYSSLYRAMTEAYYRRLAEESSR